MSRRIDIELTSSRPDGTWTWRAAGAREPKGVLDGDVLPGAAKVGDVFKVDAEFDIDGIEILGVVTTRTKTTKIETLALLADERPFEPVTQQLARRDRSDRRRDDRRDRRDRPPRGDRNERGDRTDRRDRPERGDRDGRDRSRTRTDEAARPRGPRRPRFEAPPEIPQRPRPKRLKAGAQHRKALLETIAENQRPIAEIALQGMQAVRQKLKSANEALAAEGKPTMPEQSVLQMAQDLLPKLRVADWLDRAEAAKRDLDTLDLRDLRSVVAAANDPSIARDESCRVLVDELKAGLATRTESDYQNWLADIEASLAVGRVVRALKMSGQPPKAGQPFPDELGRRLAEATSSNLTADALPERWIAVLEAVAFSPVRSHLVVTAPPSNVSAELTKTVERLAALLPSVAALFGVSAPTGGHAPKPLRPTRTKKIPPKPPVATASTTSVTSESAPADVAPVDVAPVEIPSTDVSTVESAPIANTVTESAPSPATAVASDPVPTNDEGSPA